jgi:hypothetical protein
MFCRVRATSIRGVVSRLSGFFSAQVCTVAGTTPFCRARCAAVDLPHFLQTLFTYLCVYACTCKSVPESGLFRRICITADCIANRQVACGFLAGCALQQCCCWSLHSELIVQHPVYGIISACSLCRLQLAWMCCNVPERSKHSHMC